MPSESNEQSPRLSREPEFLRDLGVPARTCLSSRWTLVQGTKLHSRSFSRPGDAAPFVLIHGLVISSLYMIPLAECLAERHEVHALDLPGFGRGEAPAKILSIPELADAVVGWLEQADIPRCHLVANSLGCEIAAHVAVKAPGRVASLVLIGPTLDPHAFAVTIQTLRLMRDALHEPLRLWMNWIFDFCRAGVRRALGTAREMFRDHIENQLPLVTAPTLIIRGGIDPTVPQRAAETMQRLLPRGGLLVLEGRPHCVHYTDPRTVCRAVEAHAGRTSAQSIMTRDQPQRTKKRIRLS
ncbi:MAG TPA: alpha/beta fold hydrolase [Chthoniobacteraceae bacterium]|jgi:pimeloyl-ACP methyl ester carboxylesterase|nr:alpha/beta fold hydrolase [Chthoniobacteraceae bacterium]